MHSLSEVIDIFKCCIFNWGALTTILPAFLIAGAIIAFIPSSSVTRYLGSGAKKYISYPAAALAGAILPACSCNIVPLFASILERGSGIGPAFTFLYAGPAINLISAIFTFRVIGPVLGAWRLAGVFGISIVLGLVMEILFGRKGGKTMAAEMNLLDAEKINKGRLLLLFALLFGILIAGSSLTPAGFSPALTQAQIIFRAAVFLILAGLLFFLIRANFKKAEVWDWLKQAWRLLRMIVPVFLLSILIIGLIAKYIDIRWLHSLFSAKKDALGSRMFGPALRATFYATVFGELMYFPILSEIAFTKAFLKLGIDIGPALAILLAGPGTSLPGLALISRITGLRKVGAYLAASVALEVAFVSSVTMAIGDYICACLNLK